MAVRLLLFFSSFLFITANSISCIQCGNNEAWYSDEEHEKRLTACREGSIAPTPCQNLTHTHCIVNWYQTGGSKEKIVTERRCGVEGDVTGCTLYNSKISRKVRHLLNRDDSASARRETATSFVEVCSQNCPLGRCVNSSFRFMVILSIFLPFFITAVLQ